MNRTGADYNIVAKERTGFDPFRLISNEEYSKNLNAITAYYQISKGETNKRFVSSSKPWDEELLAS
jgi:hypothetical protein